MQDDVDLGQRLRSLLHYWWLVLGLAVIGALLAGSWSASQPDTFRADARILLRAPSSGSQFVDSLSPVAMESERQLLLSRIVLERVADQSFNETRVTMSEDIDAEVDPDSNVLVLKVERRDPDHAAQLANAVTQAYLARREEVRQAQLRELPEPSNVEEERLQREAQYINRTARAEVISPAVAPDDPVSPQPVLMFLAGGVAGALLGGFGALGLHTSSGRIRSSSELRQVLQSAVVWARVAHPTQPDPGAYNAAAAAIAHLRADRPSPIVALVASDNMTSADVHGTALAQALTSLGSTLVVLQPPRAPRPRFRSAVKVQRTGGPTDGLSDPKKWFDRLGDQGDQAHTLRVFSMLPGVEIGALLKRPSDGSRTPEDGPFLVLPRQDAHDPTVLLEASQADAVLLLVRHNRSSKHSVSAVASGLALAGAQISGVVVVGVPPRRLNSYED